jgi:penicillin-binding protein 2
MASTRRLPVTARSTAARKPVRRRVYFNPWKEPTYADSTEGDSFDGDDPIVRRAAIEALGPLNGSVVVSDPQSGRILTIVNQQVAFRESYTPCSTIKIFVALGGLSEGVIERTTDVQVNRRASLNLTEALAHSDNPYFSLIGQKLGFDRVNYYARLFGLGERATTSRREIPGTIDAEAPDGVGMMSSFGHGVKLSPLQLTAALGAIANGGTLHYLQYPASQTEASRHLPRIKRHIEIEPFLPEIKPGMMAAVETGTARRAGFDPDEPIFGKTGTCTDRLTPTHLGWFGSYNEVAGNKLVVVVLLTGGAPINGPVASGVAGRVYRTLSERGYYSKRRPISSAALIDPAASGFGQP